MKTATILSVLLVSAMTTALTNAFADQQDKPLGDVAREQRQRKTKTARQKFTNEHFATATAKPSTHTDGAEAKPTSNALPSATQDRGKETETGESTVDQSSKSHQDKKDEMLVVPARTQVSVQFTQPIGAAPNVITGRVSVPVRVGWTTAIPAGSKVKMNTNMSIVELDAIIMQGVEYKVKTNAMPLSADAWGSDCELPFVLKEAFEIPR